MGFAFYRSTLRWAEYQAQTYRCLVLRSIYVFHLRERSSSPAFLPGELCCQAQASIERCNSGHLPHLSQPEVLVQKIRETVQKVVGK